MLTLRCAADAVIITNNTLLATDDVTLENADLIVSNAVFTVEGTHTFASVLVGVGGKVTHTFSGDGLLTNGAASALNLTIAGSLEVLAGGQIIADGLGMTNGIGSGASSGTPASGGGGGHGGYGGQSSSNAPGGNCFGALTAPLAHGRGGGAGAGGAGGAGGGAIRISVGGQAKVDGVISANGLNATNSRSGGGSGGSIWLDAQTFSGTGLITAHGGHGEPIHGGGGGGGGCIAIYCDTNVFTRHISTFGGLGYQAGSAGTIYFKNGSKRLAGAAECDPGCIPYREIKYARVVKQAVCADNTPRVHNHGAA